MGGELYIKSLLFILLKYIRDVFLLIAQIYGLWEDWIEENKHGQKFFKLCTAGQEGRQKQFHLCKHDRVWDRCCQPRSVSRWLLHHSIIFFFSAAMCQWREVAWPLLPSKRNSSWRKGIHCLTAPHNLWQPISSRRCTLKLQGTCLSSQCSHHTG